MCFLGGAKRRGNLGLVDKHPGSNTKRPIAALRSKALLAMTFYENAPLEHKLKDRLPQSP
jgi:hypothetical protein